MNNLNVLHLPNTFLPWNTGGTETYTYGLAKSLRKLGVNNHFCIHARGKSLEMVGEHHYDHFPVTVLPPIPDESNRLSIYTRQFNQIPGFEAYLEKTKPDIIHFHDLMGGSSLSHLKMAHEKGISTVLTYHSPGQSCLQKALRFAGQEICDGVLSVNRCTKCNIMSRGLPGSISPIINLMGTNWLVSGQDSPSKKLITLPSAISLFIESFHESIELVDRIHAHAHWVEKLLVLNGVRKEKIFFARTAGPESLLTHTQESLNSANRDFDEDRQFTAKNPLKIVFSGRCEYVKGVHILIDAALSLPKDLPVAFYFYGPYWDSTYSSGLKEKMKEDPRFHAPELLKPQDVIHVLRSMDLMVVPSIWPETGPLTLLEGLSAGLPVIGSDLGGIPEWIKPGINGFLFKHGDPQDLKDQILKIVEKPKLLIELKKGARMDRTMEDLALEIHTLYQELSKKLN